MKHATTIFCLFLLAATGLHSQSKESPEVRSSFDLIFGVENSYRSLNRSSTSFPLSSHILTRNQSEIPSVNYRFGLNYNQKLFGRFFLKTGARWIQTGYKTPKSELIWPSEIDPVTGEIIDDPSLPQWLILKNRYYFLEIPLQFRYHFSENKIQPFIGAGASWNVFMNAREISITDQGRQVIADTLRMFNQVNIALTATFGFDFSFWEKHRLFAQVMGRYHLSSLEANNKIVENLYNYGIETGFRFGL